MRNFITKKIYLLVILCFTFFACPAYSVDYKNDQKLLDNIMKANECLENNDLTTARVIGKEIIAKYPTISDGYFVLAPTYGSTNPTKTLEMYTKSLSINNFVFIKKYDAYLQRGIVYWDYNNNLQLALSDFNNAISNIDTYSQKAHIVYTYRGELKTFLNSPVGATADLKKALSFDRIYEQKEILGRTYAFLSKAAYMQGKYEESIKYAQIALKIVGVDSSYASVIAEFYIMKSAYANKDFQGALVSAELIKSFLIAEDMTNSIEYKETIEILTKLKN